MDKFKRLENESELEYQIRICELKQQENLTWQEIADTLNKELDNSYSESKYRKFYQAYIKGCEDTKKNICESNNVLDELELKKIELYKQQVKTRDAHREYRKILRDDARNELLLDYLKENITPLQNNIRIFGELEYPKKVKNEAVVLLSDLHFGGFADNFYNKYNKEIAIQRLNKYKDNILKYARINQVWKINVVNLGDMIENVFHQTARVENDLNGIDQIIEVSEILSQFLKELSVFIPQIVYYSTNGNHDRLIQAYKDSSEDENFIKLIDHIMQLRLRDVKNIEFNKNSLDPTMNYFELDNGKLFGYAHGAMDKVNMAYQTFSSAFKKNIDYIALGHLHTNKIKEFNGSIVYLNGAIKGVDSYARNNRYFAKPSQTMIIFDKDTNDEIEIRCNLN